MTAIYCKYSNDRDRSFQIKTSICEKTEGGKYVLKSAVSEEAKSHVERLYKNYLNMKESFEGTILTPNRCWITKEGVGFEFIEGKTLERYLDELYEKKDYLRLIEEIKNFRDILYSLEDNIPFEYTADFDRVFGSDTNFAGCRSLKISNIDLVFANIILGEKWTVLDYEWIFDFPVPIDFIIYRALYYYVHGSTKRSDLIDLHVFKLMGICDEDMQIYQRMENHFQSYVAGKRVTMAQLKKLMLKRCQDARQLENQCIGDYAQVYFHTKEGYSEKNSVKKQFDYSETTIQMSVIIPDAVDEIRFDPAVGPVAVPHFSVISNDTKKTFSVGTGKILGDEGFLFIDTEPSIYITVNAGEIINIEYSAVSLRTKALQESFEILIQNEDAVKAEKVLLEEKIVAQMENLSVKERDYGLLLEEKDKLKVSYGQLIEEYNRVSAENNQRIDYINHLHSRFGWRILSIGKRTLKSIKNVGLVNTFIKGAKKIKRKISRTPEASAVITNVNMPEQEQTGTIMKEQRSGKEKILVVVHEAQRAGATLLSMNIIKTIKSITDYEPVVLLIAGGPLTENIKRFGICYELEQRDFSHIYDEERLSVVLDEIEQLGIKYALCNSVVTGLVLEGLKKRNIKTVTMVHELPTSIRAYDFIQAAEAVQKYSDDIVFAAKFVQDKYMEEFPVEKERCHIIPQGCYSTFNSLNITEKKNNKQKLCRELGIEENAEIMLGCGYGNFRKGLDWFGMIASLVMEKRSGTHFVWLGEKNTEFMTWINNDLSAKGLSDRFHWMGHVENPGYVFGGADLFLLTSREDPFPSVALEAMKQYTPVLAFEGAGGIPEVLTKGRGSIVPYGDCTAFAGEVEKLLTDQSRYLSICEKAKAYVDEITPRNYVTGLLKLLIPGEVKIRKISHTKVSVVIPNYNYEQYIYERLSCILNQTVKPYEIIFLDDVSKDNSVAVAKEILQASGVRYRIITNTENQGCFRQWLKGIRCAEGDIIWIAEADDACELDFLERLLPFFEDDQVNLAYAQSEVIYEHDERSGYIYTEYTKDLSETKWNHDYVNYGEAEIIEGLGIKNTIPNASGVLMRKSAFDGIDSLLQEFSISGDWFAYVYLIKTGKIAFCSDVLNYHRRHSTSIIHKKEQDVKLFEELMRIKLFIAENFMIPLSIRDSFIQHVQHEYMRLMPSDAPEFDAVEILRELKLKTEQLIEEKLNIYSFLRNIPQKNILFVMPDFEMGGGQTLVVRLANFFSRFHHVYLYNARPWLREERIERMILPKVMILDSNGTPEQLRSYIQKLQIEIINDHIWWSDKLVYKAAADLNTRIVLSMHGCYEALLQHPEWDEEFTGLVSPILKRADEIIYATAKNKRIFEHVPVEGKTHQIYYGYELESIPPKNRAELGIEEDSFVFGLVARGIKEKGFGEATEAFKKLSLQNGKKMDLILIGNGPYIDELKAATKDEFRIHFVDNLSKPSEWIGWVKTFDCALLPTYFVSESLPNSVIEYLAYGVPVISTNIGDIRYMLKNSEAEAGIVLELVNGTVQVEDLKEAMEMMVEDTRSYKIYKEGAKVLFRQFDMKEFAENYYRLFTGILK